MLNTTAEKGWPGWYDSDGEIESMVPFYCSFCIAGSIFRSLHHFSYDDSLSSRSAPSLSPSLLPLGWIGFSYHL